MFLGRFLIQSLLTINFCFAEMERLSHNQSLKSEDEIYMRVDDMIVLKPTAREGSSSEDFRWPDGIIHYEVEKGLSHEKLEMLETAMEILEEQTCLEFVVRQSENNYLFITHSNKGCYAHVGFMNRGKQKLNLGKGCWKFGTVIHELIHSIGFSHSHQRNDRDNYVIIRYDNIKQDKKHNFMLDNEMGMDSKYFGLPYNYASVMHYRKMSFSVNGKSTIVPKKLCDIEDFTYYDEIDEYERPVIGRGKLSWGDIEMINHMYDDDYC